MTDEEAWERHCAEADGPPFVCHECDAAIDPTDHAAIEEHREGHWEEFLRSQCPIPKPPLPTREDYRRLNEKYLTEDEPEVPF